METITQETITQKEFEDKLERSTNRPLNDTERKELAGHFAAALARAVPMEPEPDLEPVDAKRKRGHK
jgi:hypothetical protein